MSALDERRAYPADGACCGRWRGSPGRSRRWSRSAREAGAGTAGAAAPGSRGSGRWGRPASWTRSSRLPATPSWPTRRRSRGSAASRRSSARPYEQDLSEVDIGVIGVPFDGGVTNRPGTRHGPREVRNQSSLSRRINTATGVQPFDTHRVRDLGDCWIEQPYALEPALAEIEGFYRRVVSAGRGAAVGGRRPCDRRCRSCARSAADGPVGMVHIDAHCRHRRRLHGVAAITTARRSAGRWTRAAGPEAGDPDRHPRAQQRGRRAVGVQPVERHAGDADRRGAGPRAGAGRWRRRAGWSATGPTYCRSTSTAWTRPSRRARGRRSRAG